MKESEKQSGNFQRFYSVDLQVCVGVVCRIPNGDTKTFQLEFVVEVASRSGTAPCYSDVLSPAVASAPVEQNSMNAVNKHTATQHEDAVGYTVSDTKGTQSAYSSICERAQRLPGFRSFLKGFFRCSLSLGEDFPSASVRSGSRRCRQRPERPHTANFPADLNQTECTSHSIQRSVYSATKCADHE